MATPVHSYTACGHFHASRTVEHLQHVRPQNLKRVLCGPLQKLFADPFQESHGSLIPRGCGMNALPGCKCHRMEAYSCNKAFTTHEGETILRLIRLFC